LAKKQEEAQNKASKNLKNNPKEIHRPNIDPNSVYNVSMPTKK
jgi:hypothetical protein